MSDGHVRATIYPRHHRAWLEVRLDALRHNARVLRARAGVPLLPMVKADAYGLGAVAVCRALGLPFTGKQAQEAAPDAPWGVGIASVDEAAELRTAGYAGRILCVTPLLATELPRARALDVRPALHRVEDLTAWRRLGGAPWHLSIDTGMARAGVRWDAVEALAGALLAMPPEGIFTHFHSADEDLVSRDEQDARFEQALAALGDAVPEGVLLHRDNSGGIVSRHAGSPGHLARPGIALYAGMFDDALGLEPVAHFRARVVDIREVREGESVSYGATWRAQGTRRIATLASGYADGYRRHLSNRGEVLINGHRCPVAGRVTMDMTMVDVTEASCAVGDIATLLGSDSTGDGTGVNTIVLTPGMVAARADVSPYELLVGLALRVPRILLEDAHRPA